MNAAEVTSPGELQGYLADLLQVTTNGRTAAEVRTEIARRVETAVRIADAGAQAVGSDMSWLQTDGDAPAQALYGLAGLASDVGAVSESLASVQRELSAAQAERDAARREVVAKERELLDVYRATLPSRTMPRDPLPLLAALLPDSTETDLQPLALALQWASGTLPDPFEGGQ